MSGTKRNYAMAWIWLQGREFDMPDKESYSENFKYNYSTKLKLQKRIFLCPRSEFGTFHMLLLFPWICASLMYSVALYVLILSFVMILNIYYYVFAYTVCFSVCCDCVFVCAELK